MVDAVGVESTWAVGVPLSVGAGGAVSVNWIGAESGEVSLAAGLLERASASAVSTRIHHDFAKALAMLDRRPPSVDWTSEAPIE